MARSQDSWVLFPNLLLGVGLSASVFLSPLGKHQGFFLPQSQKWVKQGGTLSKAQWQGPVHPPCDTSGGQAGSANTLQKGKVRAHA